MTLVWRTESGTLLQTQVGLADVVTTLAAANSTNGWLGGLDGARFLLSKISNSFSRRLKELDLDKSLRLLPVTAHVLTSGGPLIFSIPNVAEAFGGDPRTQLIGLTLCALAHELQPHDALELFIQFLAPKLFDGVETVADAIRSQLNDESNLQRIINEGASRGMTHLFMEAVSGLNIAFGDREWLQAALRSDDDMLPLPSEILMVGGMLKWLLNDDRNTYHTRSGLVARVAAYLRVVGYNIGRIQSWDGGDNVPTNLGAKAVLLVTGGSSSTDPLMLDPEEMIQQGRTHHYQFRTAGAMLLDALENVSGLYPEVFQTHFETIFFYFKSHLNIRYILNTSSEIVAKLDWRRYVKGSTSIEKRLASIYFPLSAEYIAPCYGPIASPEALDQILKGKSAIATYDDIGDALALFRVLSAAIVLSMTARLASSTFETVSHSTDLMLAEDETWLGPMCKVLDGAFSSGLELHKAVSALAAVHAAHSPEEIAKCEKRVIAWRHGIYAVVPSLLLSMTPNEEGIGFQCLDRYWANVTVREDGSIRSAVTKGTLQNLDLIEELVANGPVSSALQTSKEPWFGVPAPGSPDVPLYLSIERPLHYSDPDLCFVGRVGGSIVGSAGINDVLKTLVLSLREPMKCRGHASPSRVVNVKASSWIADKNMKIAGEEQLTFIPVSGDPCWALFLAGETVYFNGRIVFNCIECAAREAGPHGVLIGFL